MSISESRIHYLLEVHISKQANAIEEKELMEWVLEAEEDSELRSFMLNIWSGYTPGEEFSYVNWKDMLSNVMQQPLVSAKPKLRKLSWGSLAAAAVILIVLLGVAYLFFNPVSPKSVVTNISKQRDIAPPSGNKAVLTLSDGTKLEIDTSGKGTLAMQGNVQIVKLSSGEIRYNGTQAGEVSYNTLSVPKGSKPINLWLSDGSEVWMNVGSSLTYPTTFTGNERKVKITGEAYFEVAHNSAMPFIVEHEEVTVNVLGTHFNVNTYEDESSQRITLLEGSVRVRRNMQSQLLKPGQQAFIENNDNGDIKIADKVNIEEVMAWKNGKFRFGENTRIDEIMRQISRWYNVDIEYQGEIKQRFWGTVSKDVNLSQVLKILEATGGAKFKIEGNKIIVMAATP